MPILLLKPQAYLDPGSGSLLLQIILATLLGAGFLIKTFWKKILSLANRITGKSADPEETHLPDDK